MQFDRYDYIDCVCCRNQFTNKHKDDPDTFVCNSCDDARREWLVELHYTLDRLIRIADSQTEK